MSANRKPFRVLFVCMGNICRSPAAEIVCKKMLGESDLADSVELDSAGTIGYHTGNGPDPRMAATLKARGYPVFGRARQITAGDLDDFNLILVADEENLADVRRLDRDGSRSAKIRLLVEYCETHDAPRVPDPYYGGQRGFEEVADLMEDACGGLLRNLERGVRES
ncbi:low molecular weight protein-tyrosine-phosphatase [Luteolibacter sp. Populi]|uniref:low molecular weight protein-tyrosine-phosphatase n=1 Tax=Luteolibacter sp. Populi TaxID=3230487 RepID=UPI003465AFDD